MKRFLHLIILCLLNGMFYANTKPAIGFIENKGQIHDQNFKANTAVKYLLSVPGMNIQLKQNSFSYDTYLVEQKNTETIRETDLAKLKRPAVENLQLVDALAYADVADGDFELVADAEGHAAFGRTVEFGEGEAGDGGHFGELLGLLLSVLAGAGIQHEQHVVGRTGQFFLDGAVDFSQLLHQVGLVVEAASGVDDGDIAAELDCVIRCLIGH